MKRFALLVSVAVLSQGCSFRFVDGPPQIRPGAPVPATARCTTNSVIPIVDIIIGVSATIMVTEAVDLGDGLNSGEVLTFAFPVGFFGSAFEGFNRTRRCREFLATPAAPDTTGLAWAPIWPMSPSNSPVLLARPLLPEIDRPASTTNRER